MITKLLIPLVAALGLWSIKMAVAAEAPRLRAQVTVATELVRIGDLVEGAGALAGVAVFRAPDLGQTGTVQTIRVIEALRAQGLATLDHGGLAEVEVSRASRVLAGPEIERALADALKREGRIADPDALAVTLDRALLGREWHYEPAATAPAQVMRLSFDARTGRFDALIGVPGSTLRREPLRITGTAIETAEVVTLARPVERGQPIRDADLVTERRPRGTLLADALTTRAAALGMAARRPLRAGEPLRTGDLVKPDLVTRNDTVTLVYEVPGIVLTVRGRALESGAEGDTVPVLNLQSRRIIQGVVTGTGKVSVLPGAVTTPARTAAAPGAALPR